MKKNTIGFFGLTLCTAVVLVYVLPAGAIPCGSRPGIVGSVACLDGAPDDNTLGEGDDKAFDLNAGNYFNYNDWSFLQLKGSSGDETAVDVGLEVELFTNAVGSWSIIQSAWEDSDNLVIILKSDTTGEDKIYWSSYLLADGQSASLWVSGRPLSSLSIFGRASVVIPEPVTWSMVVAGLAMMWAEKIRQRRTFSEI